ncbi:MAG: UPF0182 family protein [Desulfobacteraceae bacterium]|uniref:UPF0182 protein H8E19_10370 n=1 Tax=Candidatus Desulfacyla euxinica TaxID=2841693 RepID=A0A8J6MYX9_9DELT|nr:UPF0182 family protein [Candidatus Desulfacyla euxinica]MBL6978115.1 UPF0182 family protein [Desulfobacteraceae bacterium]MBL7217881.1 UPF0182 family protein [Desulfobacteraceae bacterium]
MKIKLLIGCGLLILLLLFSIVSIYPDWLWFKNLGFSPVFWTMLSARFGFGFVVWSFLILIIAVNLYIAKRLSPEAGPGTSIKDEGGFASQVGLSPNTLNLLFLGFILIASFVIASNASDKWNMVLRFLYWQPFGSTDPIFNRDIGFYVFALPFYAFIRSGLLILFLLAGGLTIIWYLKNGALQIIGEIVQVEGKPPSLPKIKVAPTVKKHLIFLGGIIVLLLAWGYQLKIYGLLYSTLGPAFGASYTDVHIKIWVFRLLILVSLAFAVLLFINAFKPQTKLILVSGAIWVGSILVFATILPLVIQKIVVKPNELAKESKYIGYNIDFTRKAYNLNKIKEVSFDVSDKLTLEEVKKERATIQNIRVWDERPLLQTYKQIQAIRLYYDFNNVDVDRYRIEDQYRQLMLAAREMVVDQLPRQANTWVNRHLTYTHGYGLAASPVNEVTNEGLPRLFIKDVPPVSDVGFKIDRPEIYYGEKTNQYVLVNTKTKEFDYPRGDSNVYTVYEGKGGVPINSFIRRVLFAIEFMDSQILFTEYLTPESRIMYNRTIRKRANSLAPFLQYDRDPYLVLSGEKLYWMIDAYTTTDMYPYSFRSHGPFKNPLLNYVRNSVKVTVDAYNGDVCFYLIDEEDPIANVYASIFPDLFKPFTEMPEDLQKHIRYPKDLFNIQAAAYANYHMQDPQVFYNQEDLWQLPDELYGDTRQKMEPYYIIMKLPEGEKEEFLLMLPYTPSEKDNMIGWLAARSDLPNYGHLVVYNLPKEKLVYGPMQIEARIDQQTEISRKLSLWDQRGSRVIRGNLLAIPIRDSFIYVEPIYLQAEQEESTAPATGAPQARGLGKPGGRQGASAPARKTSVALPELKRVIVTFSNRIAMEETLDKALSSVLGGEISARELAVPAAIKTLKSSNLGILALDHYNKAKGYLRQGNWTGYGEELARLEEVLKQLSVTTEQKKP